MRKAVILAAGKSTRTTPLTKPKPLLKAANKTILEHNLQQLNNLVKEVIIVIGYKGDQIKQTIGNQYKNLKIRYVEQKKQLGSAHAILQTKKYLDEKFIILNGDDFYHKKDIQKSLKHDYCILIKTLKDVTNNAIIIPKGKYVKKIIEKPKNPPTNQASTGLYVLKKDIFNTKLKKSERGEYEITTYLEELTKQKKLKYETSTQTWIPIVYSWDLLTANEHFLKKIKKNIQGKVESLATIKNNIMLGEGSIIKSGAYIEGPAVIGKNCIIGPNCYIRSNTTIGNNCKIGNAVEIKNTIIGDNTNVGHLSYIGDSILGDNVNIGAGTITANLRHDKGNIKSTIKGKLVCTGRKKLGIIIGDNAKTGIKTSFYPGRKMDANTTTTPGEIVKHDKKCVE